MVICITVVFSKLFLSRTDDLHVFSGFHDLKPNLPALTTDWWGN